ncbi:MAG: hypothetical protein MUE73_06950 [Planctomycetes bacterium]|jgi:hypothetical protein|nr:hypothetical protein [Planctomycetota bacterium]
MSMKHVAGCLLLLGVLAAPSLAEVRGKWHDSPDRALSAAQKERKPILAAAMDHG